MKPFKKTDSEVIRGYDRIRAAINEVLGRIASEIKEEYDLESDQGIYEQGKYFYLLFQAPTLVVSPGLKVSPGDIISPIMWIAGERLKKDDAGRLGFKKDPDFEDYFVLTGAVEEGFFEMEWDGQVEHIVTFYREVLARLLKEGLIGPNLGPGRTFIAG